MPIKPVLRWLYLANATVLITHQIDAAYWHEWTLFGLPGGNQLNLLLNIPIVLLVLLGLQALVAGRKGWQSGYRLLAAAGFFAVGIHGYFLLNGSAAFCQPASLALLLATALLSSAQLLALRICSKPSNSPP